MIVREKKVRKKPGKCNKRTEKHTHTHIHADQNCCHQMNKINWESVKHIFTFLYFGGQLCFNRIFLPRAIATAGAAATTIAAAAADFSASVKSPLMHWWTAYEKLNVAHNKRNRTRNVCAVNSTKHRPTDPWILQDSEYCSQSVFFFSTIRSLGCVGRIGRWLNLSMHQKIFSTNYKSWTPFLLSVWNSFLFPVATTATTIFEVFHSIPIVAVFSTIFSFFQMWCLLSIFPSSLPRLLSFPGKNCRKKKKLAEDMFHFGIHKKWICNESFKVFPKIFVSFEAWMAQRERERQANETE